MKKYICIILCIACNIAYAADAQLDDLEDIVVEEGYVPARPTMPRLDGTKAHAKVLKNFAIAHLGEELSQVDESIFRNHLKLLRDKQTGEYDRARLLLSQITPKENEQGKTRQVRLTANAAAPSANIDPTTAALQAQELITLIAQALHTDNTAKATTIDNQGNALTRNHATLLGSLGATALSVAVIILQAYLTSKNNCNC